MTSERVEVDLALLLVPTTDLQCVPGEAGLPFLGVRDGCVSWARARRLLSWKLGGSHPLCRGLGVVLVHPPALPGRGAAGLAPGGRTCERCHGRSLADAVWGGRGSSGQLESGHHLRTGAAAPSSAILLFLT